MIDWSKVKTAQDKEREASEQLQAQINSEALAYLASTDWYVIRMHETGEPVPEGVLAERETARARVVR